MSDPLAAARNLAAKGWRRAAALPRRGVRWTRRAGRLREQASAFHAEWQIEREIAAIAHGRGPIVVGPWLSEVGFEVLYWIPFVRWFEDRYRVHSDRVIALSRGGVAEWYGDLATRYVEIFDHVPPVEFGRRNRERHEQDEAGGQKQTTAGAFDHDLLAVAKKATGIRDAAVLHPSLMYRLFTRFWHGNRALDLVASHTRFVPVQVEPAKLDLPSRYVAAKFYTGAALPGTPEARGALRELVRVTSARIPVVMLDTGMATDEHEDYLFRDLPNVISLRDQLQPTTNLGVQTRVVAASQGFMGTCGSLAWLAPLLGVDTLAVYSEERFLVSHIFFATQAYRQMGAARFDSLDLRGVTELDLLAPGAAVAQGQT
jgi:hypothetical protein